MKTWLKAAAIRAIKTICQVMVAMIPVGVMVTEVNWKSVVFTAILAGILSMLTSVAGLPEVKLQQSIEQHMEEEKDDR